MFIWTKAISSGKINVSTNEHLVQMNKKCSIELKSKISPFAHKKVLVQMNILSANEQKYV